MPGCRLVATDDAGWSDGLWETDLCARRSRGSCQRLTVPSIDSASSLLVVNREELTHRSSSMNQNQRLSLSSVGFDPSKFISACQMKPTIGLKYLCPAGAAASWGPCPMGLTGLSAPTVTPEHHTENYQTFNSLFFSVSRSACVKLMCPPWWIHFYQEHHRRLMLSVRPHRLIWTLIAERRKTGGEVLLI